MTDIVYWCAFATIDPVTISTILNQKSCGSKLADLFLDPRFYGVTCGGQRIVFFRISLIEDRERRSKGYHAQNRCQNRSSGLCCIVVWCASKPVKFWSSAQGGGPLLNVLNSGDQAASRHREVANVS